MKGVEKYMEIVLIVFLQINSCLEKMEHFGHKNRASSNLLLQSKDYFQILDNERVEEVH